MDIALLIIACVLMLGGIAGSFLPILPGPPLCFAGFLVVQFSIYASFSTEFLIIWAVVVVILGILEYYIPTWGTKKFGGTKSGQKGATVGTILGIFIPPQPLWLILGPFVGAYLGELIHDARDNKKALRSAWGSFIGFLAGTFIKVVTVIVMAVFFIREVT
ncbi:MAG TPA: DUF456 domain-containing protein [Chitinophagales bacterium]|nr:DUF456 domain-containing protein [Chitinophagales bacterium]HMZ89205.1 DUF456 domain-containing protein [Chitinophagales bacterium]HNE46965.1 DUF456 domain-containing protein [Chitinophagales bacterium]HNI53885.1 DUF456 domain-containing protein [Chitinophagales bacterium]HNK96966.1 DUF456 domain-containing protein [Chitinophagales bacterium]